MSSQYTTLKSKDLSYIFPPFRWLYDIYETCQQCGKIYLANHVERVHENGETFEKYQLGHFGKCRGHDAMTQIGRWQVIRHELAEGEIQPLDRVGVKIQPRMFGYGPAFRWNKN